MLTQFFNKFKSHPTPEPSRSSSSYKFSEFHLGKKDGKYFADPATLGQLDAYQAHHQAAEELNSHLALLTEVRTAVLSLEGSAVDQNPRPEIVAVTDYPLNGKTVEAVVRHATDNPTLEARVFDNGKTITIMEEAVPLSPARKLDISANHKSYHVEDENKGGDWVKVKLKVWPNPAEAD